MNLGAVLAEPIAAMTSPGRKRAIALATVLLGAAGPATAAPAGGVASPTSSPAVDDGAAAPGEPALTDAELLAQSEAEAEAEVIEVWEERPEKPFDRDTTRRLTGAELAARGATDLGSALALLPDVSVRDVGRGGFNVDIRGARKGAVRVLIDGVSVSDPYYGTFDVSTIPVTDIAEIRVSTSPSSPIDGPGGPGGVIEVHTHDAIGPSFTIARLVGTTQRGATASATGRVALTDRLAVRLSTTAGVGNEEFSTPRGSVDEDRRATSGALRLEYRHGQRRVVVDGFADDRRYLAPPSDELATALFLLVGNESTGRVGVAFDDALGASQRLQLKAASWLHATSKQSFNFRDPALTELANSEDLFALRAGGQALLTRPIGRDARWVTSITVDHERARSENQRAEVTRAEVTTVEVAAGGQYQRGRLRLDGAAGLAVPLGIEAGPWPEAKLSAKLDATAWASVEAIAARKGRVPSLRERFFDGNGGNTALDPEQASHGELRLVVRPRAGVELTAAPYLRLTTGTLKVGPPPDNLLVNLGRLRVAGVDLLARAELTTWAELGGGYTLADAYSADVCGDAASCSPIERFPRHRVDGWGRLRHRRGSLLVRGRFAGRAVDQTVVTPRYVLWEATATATLRPGWLVVLRADDLLDARPETRAGYHLPGRTVTALVQGTWD
ncbi:MAG: TonB-dependent receptor [Kofleriaceae bacterium]|nr:TonB-dependent receptor [Kofleriaceae bacterium]